MTASILVPLDGSSFGEHAIPLAMALAKKLSGTVHLLHVHSRLDATYGEMQVFDESFNQELRSKERDYLHGVQTKVQDTFAVPVTIHNVEGEVTKVIADQADSLQAEWVVMTTHGRGPLSRFWLGSAADELMRTLAMPLILVRPEDDAVDLSKPQEIRHILVPLDGTQFGEQILPDAIKLGQALGSEFTLLRVVTPIYPSALPAELTIFDGEPTDIKDRVDRAHTELMQEAGDYLETTAATMRAQGLKVHARVSLHDQPAVAILESAEPPIDLIAIETHGRGGLSRLLLGSVSDKVIRGAHLPILVHKPSE